MTLIKFNLIKANKMLNLFPEEILLTEIFPRFPGNILGKLSQVCPYFNILCRDEDLWKIRIEEEYPGEMQFKPYDLSFKNYYIFLFQSWQVPVYYIDKYLGKVRITSDNIDIALGIPKINKDLTIIFVNSGLDPIVIVEYPSMKKENFPGRYKDIRKIVVTGSFELFKKHMIETYPEKEVYPMLVYHLLNNTYTFNGPYPNYGYLENDKLYLDQKTPRIKYDQNGIFRPDGGILYTEASVPFLIKLLWIHKVEPTEIEILSTREMIGFIGENKECKDELWWLFNGHYTNEDDNRIIFYYRWLNTPKEGIYSIIKRLFEERPELLISN